MRFQPRKIEGACVPWRVRGIGSTNWPWHDDESQARDDLRAINLAPPRDKIKLRGAITSILPRGTGVPRPWPRRDKFRQKMRPVAFSRVKIFTGLVSSSFVCSSTFFPRSRGNFFSHLLESSLDADWWSTERFSCVPLNPLCSDFSG